ncbi:chemical-damaging agent resistance protein C [Synergistales bacterium]|nr:chemical-damaging agent resistance protein C [Synergistales bacterium]
MAVSLSKGQKVDLTKTNPGLTKITVGLGWDTNKYDGGFDFDLDTAAFLLADSGKVASDADFVFYGNKDHNSGAVKHNGDNLTGAGDGDDETISIDLSKIPAEVAKVDFTVTIHEAEERKQNFGQVSNAYIHVVNETSNEELIRYDLGEDYSVETAVIVAELYRSGAEWKFNAIGSGFAGGLKALCGNFGVNV